jgi:hypothetical protein
VQKRFTLLKGCVVSWKRAIVLLSGLMLFLSSQVMGAVESEAQSTPLHAERSNKSKINKITDLRILVDISGSMKNTDPNNLRRSAVRLLAGLIPANSRAGMWNFGQQVNMAVKVGLVNEAWRELARTESKNINSAGLYTNIEDALRKVSFDWKKADPRYKRNLILLTDGHVDVSQNDKINKASRKRILKEIIPLLEQAKVKVHTIALSDDVDERLLTTLSAYTDGLYKKVKNSNDLQKIFLQMLEQSVKLDTLPIKDNSFSVDASINDMTLLIFNNDKAQPTKIVTPGQTRWGKNTASKQLKWFGDDGYDLITIKKPQQGLWKIIAPSDENNRVVVATNLTLKLNELPGSLMLGDVLNIVAHLEVDGKPLTNQGMLSRFKFVLSRKSERSSARTYPLTKTDADGFSYSIQLAPIFKLGNNELIIQAISPTTEREIHHQFKVYTNNKTLDLDENKAKKIDAPNPHQVKAEENNKHEAKVEEHGKTQATKQETSHAESKKPQADENNKELEHKNDRVAEAATKKNEVDWAMVSIAILAGNLLLIGIVVGGYLLVKRRKAKLVESLDDDDSPAANDKTAEKKSDKSTGKEK